ncbi:MAG: hypothetical protein WKF47_04980 [Geodermatophilaceae bacterium]
MPAPELAGTGAVRVFQLVQGRRAGRADHRDRRPDLPCSSPASSAPQDTITVGRPSAIAPSLTGVTDVSWTSADSLIVLATEPRRRPGRPVHDRGGRLGNHRTDHRRPARGTRRGGRGSQPGVIWSRPAAPSGSSASTVWAVLIRGQAPLPGTAPFYPS